MDGGEEACLVFGRLAAAEVVADVAAGAVVSVAMEASGAATSGATNSTNRTVGVAVPDLEGEVAGVVSGEPSVSAAGEVGKEREEFLREVKRSLKKIYGGEVFATGEAVAMKEAGDEVFERGGDPGCLGTSGRVEGGPVRAKRRETAQATESFRGPLAKLSTGTRRARPSTTCTPSQSRS